jgi:hypothetical protein
MSELNPITHDNEWLSRQLTQLAEGSVGTVGATHRLIESDNTEPIIEGYVHKLGSRVLALAADSDSAKTHIDLAEHRLPVFSTMYTDELMLLLVPNGARRLSATLPALNRDPTSYRKIFFDLGRLMRDLQFMNIGLPDLTVLDRIAFATQEEGEGGKLFMIPPYNFTEPLPLDQELEQLRFELELSEVISENAMNILITQTEDGWHAIG